MPAASRFGIDRTVRADGEASGVDASCTDCADCADSEKQPDIAHSNPDFLITSEPWVSDKKDHTEDPAENQ